MRWRVLEPAVAPKPVRKGVHLAVTEVGKHKARSVRLTWYEDVLDDGLMEAGDRVTVELGEGSVADKLRITCANQTGLFELKPGRAKGSVSLALSGDAFPWPAGFKAALVWSHDQSGALNLELPPAPLPRSDDD